MDSFVLAETFKYLYLLFAESQDLILDLDQFVFTTEGHLLPLSLARLSNYTAVPVRTIDSLVTPLCHCLPLRVSVSLEPQTIFVERLGFFFFLTCRTLRDNVIPVILLQAMRQGSLPR